MCKPIVYLSQRSHTVSDQRGTLSGSNFYMWENHMQGNLVISSYCMQADFLWFYENLGKNAIQNLAHCK